MILDILENANRYAHLHPRLATAFAVLGRADLDHLPNGRLELDGDELFAVIMRIQGKSPDEAKLEVHDRYIDLHYVIAGTEEIGWKARTRLNGPPVETADDAAFHDDEPDVTTRLTPGTFAIHFPEDAHRTMVSPSDIHKVVVKIAL
ncbi:YhcH/YjgK/YiaL family protein [Pseudodesulfovibrio sp.]|uniref:YhcH/YjgK/YiaL family protein n=1 Tax=unclassified Pseudodesulfovibrio TaxID=2661612 RepID=UPI003AFFAA88